MALEGRSPKRQRLSPPAESIPGLAIHTTGDARDPAMSETPAHLTNGTGVMTNGVKQEVKQDQDAPEVPSARGATQQDEAISHDTRTGSRHMDGLQDHRRTDHEREDKPQPSTTENLPLVNRKAHFRSKPHPSQDLISLYSLSALASTVARRDPATGAKINKLRKSYEGKVKKQDLPGRNKPTVVPGELTGLMEWPEEGWYDQRIYGRDLDQALDPVRGRLFRADDVEAGKTKLARALKLNVGRLPREEDDKWRATLALDDPGPAPLVRTSSAVPTSAAINGLKLEPGTGMRASAPASPAGGLSARTTDRPDRAGKKRRYDDASFEGYEGAWVDDNNVYNTGNDRNGRGGKRRREFEHGQAMGPTTPSSAGGTTNGIFGASSSAGNMVGMRSS